MGTKGKSGKSATECQTELAAFLLLPLAERAAAPLKADARILIHVEKEEFCFRREGGANHLNVASGEAGDVTFILSLSTLRQLRAVAEAPDANLASVGMFFLDKLFSAGGDKIGFRVEQGFVSLWGKGYFSVLKAGGPEVASYLARKGFRGIGRIKEALAKVRG
jgi:hypothetical protein